jgi:hypothetical protein
MSIAAVNSGTFPTLPVTLQQIMSSSICESIVSGYGEYPSVSTVTIFGIGFRDAVSVGEYIEYLDRCNPQK